MVKVDKIIATVILSKRITMDMELPAFLPIGELSNKILETTKVVYPDQWNDVFEISLKFMGQTLAADATLAGSGVWDGAYLEIERRR